VKVYSGILIKPGPGFYEPNYSIIQKKVSVLKFPEMREKPTELDLHLQDKML